VLPAIAHWFAAADTTVAPLIAWLAVAIFISGLDDLVVDVVWIYSRLTKPRRPHRLSGGPQAHNEPRIAIFVPLWHEHEVIANMVEHNIAAIDYRNYEFFLGAYPNDQPTIAAIHGLERRYGHVHVSLCPHDGPTSKADCLNWIYQRMLMYEEETSQRFSLVLIHDAEDLIHPHSLREIARNAQQNDMIQIPVLPLPTRVHQFVHGIYCDEFAEVQIKDMIVRRVMGSFTPSAGVGTAYSRAALQKLAQASSNRVFEPACLTEDYENGMRLHGLGCSQAFVPLTRSAKGFLATREYFPRTIRAAIRQRTRWVTGIALQTWERHGWRGSPGTMYWFWRDRKGLIGNPLSLFCNLVFFYGLLSGIVAGLARMPWDLCRSVDPSIAAATFYIVLFRTTVRMMCVARVYGFIFALAIPLRSFCANYINATASFLALCHFVSAKVRGRPLVWLKTEHAYPSRGTLVAHKRKLGEILAGSAYVTERDLKAALDTQPDGVRIGEYLIKVGLLSQENLFEALSLQQGLPTGPVHPLEIASATAHALPRRVVKYWQVLPFKISDGSMFVATPEIPCDELTRELRGLTKLEIRFQLVTPDNFKRLVDVI